MDKLHSYQGWTGRFHEWRDNTRRRYTNWREENGDQNLVEMAKSYARKMSTVETKTDGDYSHIYR
jgi:solute carrier family 45 protein 1/2/4